MTLQQPAVTCEGKILRNRFGNPVLFEVTATCNTCNWQQTVECGSALAQLDHYERLEAEGAHHIADCHTNH